MAATGPKFRTQQRLERLVKEFCVEAPASLNGEGRHKLLPIGALTLNAKNPRKHSQQQLQALARSIERHGFTAPGGLLRASH